MSQQDLELWKQSRQLHEEAEATANYEEALSLYDQLVEIDPGYRRVRGDFS